MHERSEFLCYLFAQWTRQQAADRVERVHSLHDVQPEWFPFVTAYANEKHGKRLVFQMLGPCARDDEITHVRHAL
jgi:hypothetical protein